MTVRVRMYNVGFGDCFLLTLPTSDGPRKVLIDCGKHMLSKTGPKLDRIVRQVLEDIGPRVDVVVATHRHQDHVQGFADERWRSVSVGEVWMPWTEDPGDVVARDICDRQSSSADRLHCVDPKMALVDQEYLLGYAGNSLKNATAMKRLHEGFQGAPPRRFLPEAPEVNAHFVTNALPGVEVYALGPSRNPEVIREMEPPANESFLWARERGRGEVDEPGRQDWAPEPFDSRFKLNRADYEARTANDAQYHNDPVGKSWKEYFPVDWEDKIGRVFDEPVFELLTRLEAAVNSTSLVLLFHVGDAWMLFPGDAQWGTWREILKHPLYPRLLENLTFYKVGHHGSHNATPMSFVERYVNDGVRVMLPYGKVDKWESIPRAGLLAALSGKNVAFARSDEVPAAKGVFQAVVEDGEVLFIDTDVPS